MTQVSNSFKHSAAEHCNIDATKRKTKNPLRDEFGGTLDSMLVTMDERYDISDTGQQMERGTNQDGFEIIRTTQYCDHILDGTCTVVFRMAFSADEKNKHQAFRELL